MSKLKKQNTAECADVEDTSGKAVIEVEKDTTRRYNYEVVIYEDDPLFQEQYDVLTSINEAIWIKHDKDVWNEDVLNDDGSIKYNAGDLKKAHYHFILKFKNGIMITALAKKVNVKLNQIEIIKRGLNPALKYLIHYGQDEKYQYSVDEVKSNSNSLKMRFEQLIIDDTPEVQRVQQIQAMIEEFNGYIELGILGKSVQKANIWDAFRRNLTYFIKLVDLHNAKFMGLKRGQKDLEYSAYSSCKGDYDE